LKEKEIENYIIKAGAINKNSNKYKLITVMQELDNMKKNGYPDPQAACDTLDVFIQELY